jgi:hypothetical protein
LGHEHDERRPTVVMEGDTMNDAAHEETQHMAYVTLTEAQAIAGDCYAGLAHTYTQAHLRTAERTLRDAGTDTDDESADVIATSLPEATAAR